MNFYTDIPFEAKEKRRLLTALVLATALLAGIGVVLFDRYYELLAHRNNVKAAYDALLQTKDVFSHLQDMETGQRGFLLTGEEEFLEPYKKASALLDRDVALLREKAAGNTRRIAKVDELDRLIRHHRVLLERQIEGRGGELKNLVITIREAETAKAVMDHLRSLTGELLQDEKDLLDHSYTREISEREAYVRILLFSVLVALLALIVTNGMILRTLVRHRKTEQALALSREFSSIIVDNSPESILLLSIGGNIQSINRGGQRAMGLDDLASIIGTPWLHLWKGDHEKLAERTLDEARDGRTSRFEGMAPTFTGDKRWWEVVVTPIRDEEGHVNQLLVISRDITERYEIERAIRNSEERFRQMADTMPQMIWITRPDGFHEYYNKRWYEFTGTPEGSTNGEGWSGMFHADDQERAWARWRHSLETGDPYEIEYRLRRADGIYCWTLGRALPIRDAQGNITKWYGTCTVIEEQKRVEAELREARDLAEQANSAKTEFLANMSHEIRTPMNAVVGLANLLMNANLTEEKRREFIKTIQLSAQQLMELINDLLDAVKLESHNVELESIPFNLAELLEEIISVMGVRAREKNIELIVNYTPEMNADFLGDPLRLRQVLMNLVSNAVKFTPKGSVSLSADFCAKDNEKTWDICFDVVDTGIGIAPNKLISIFNKFSQADTSITRKYGGTGLGLSICKTLVELMHGEIHVVSTEGLGSKFSVRIPLALCSGKKVVLKNRRPTEGISTKGSALPPDEQPLILLVEDYRANVLVATQTIEDCGYRWELADNGVDALEKVKEKRYDVILMDVQMPKMDGMTATRKIREWEAEQKRERTPILGVTAYSMEGDRDKCIEAGMNDYISKPFNPEDLKEKVRALCKRSGTR